MSTIITTIVVLELRLILILSMCLSLSLYHHDCCFVTELWQLTSCLSAPVSTGAVILNATVNVTVSVMLIVTSLHEP